MREDTQIAQHGISSGSATDVLGATSGKTPTELAAIVAAFASSSQWLERVRLRRDQRWYEQLYQGSEYDVWVISWMPGQTTGFHDHGASSGAFVVTTGNLEEHRPGERARVMSAGQSHAFDRDYAHDVRNVSSAPAISIHAYSPPLTEMNEYEIEGKRLVPRAGGRRNTKANFNEWRMQNRELTARTGALRVEEMLAAARARLHRLSPDEAYEAMAKAGAVLVDIRPEGQRSSEGIIADALVVERNVLEWRFDPNSSSRLPSVRDHDLQVIVFCSEGYASSLAAAALQDLGLWRATDIIGGIQAWRAKGLPFAQSE